MLDTETNEQAETQAEPEVVAEETVVGETPAAETDVAGQDEEVVVSFGEEEAQTPAKEEAPEWVKELRRTAKEQKRKIRELEQALEAKKEADKPKRLEVGPKPTLSDFDFDDEKFADALLDWSEKKREHEKLEEDAKRQLQDEEAAWTAKLNEYGEKKKALAFPDFDDHEAEVRNALNQTQQGIIVGYAEDPAKLVYALGRNESQLTSVASIKDPIRFALAVKDLESKVTVTKRVPPPPEKPAPPSSGSRNSMEDALARAEERADKTGDRTEVVALRRQMNIMKNKG